jgi:cytidylate kinase
MTDKIIITISRGFGSNGVAIGKQVARTLGFGYYDDQALQEMAPRRLKRAQAELNALPPEGRALAAEEIFRLQVDQIRTLAEKESFVIMGRAADYILRDMDGVIRINIHAGFEDSVRTIVEREGLTEAEARAKIHSIDAGRAEFYLRHTGRVWNDPLSFDLTLNSASIGSQNCVDLIVQYVAIWKRSHGL